jgi:hypothetical protein
MTYLGFESVVINYYKSNDDNLKMFDSINSSGVPYYTFNFILVETHKYLVGRKTLAKFTITSAIDVL